MPAQQAEGDKMAVYIPIVDMMIFLLVFIALFLVYLAYEINKLKKIERKFERAEKKLEKEEGLLEKILRIGNKKKKRRR